MATLGRSPGAAPLTSADIPDDSITAAKIATGAITAADVAADMATQAELDTVSTVASAALPKAGGAMTGAITTNSTFDGIDIAVRDALHAPKASPTFTGTATFSGDIVPSTPLSHRNMIINGAMQVAQRGTSSTSANGFFTCDRYELIQANMDQLGMTQTQNTITDNEGFRNSLKITINTAESAQAADETQYFQYKVEAQDLTHLWYGNASAKAMTLSFYVRSNENGVYAVSMYSPDGDRNIGTTYTVADTNWQRVSWTIPGDTAGTINNDNGNGMTIKWFTSMGGDYTSASNTSWAAHASNRDAYGHTANLIDASSNYWEITGIQLELGSNATPFEHRSFGDELARCERYFQSYNLPSHTGVTYFQFADRFRGIMRIPTMRAAPTQSFVSPGYFYGYDTGGAITPTLQITEEHVHFYAEEGVTMLNGNFLLTAEFLI